MSLLNQHITIPKKSSSEDDLDFFYLRKKGIEYIESFGSKFWTDFNEHDPGITMLEMLSYAISDLGMRLNLPIENILASDDINKGIPKQFFKASEVLSSSPVTQNDYRKLFIDIKGVRNCWLAKHEKKVYVDCKKNQLSYDVKDYNNLPDNLRKSFELNGLYDLYVDFESSKPSEIEAVKEKIRKQYHANRNLCEDLVDIKKVVDYPIKICADIEVNTEADEELVHANVLHALESYLSTTVNFYSLKQMIDKGYSTLEIFDGPSLENGFIDTKELLTADLRNEVRLSDIMRIIMSVPDVILIKDISLGNCNGDDLENKWLICLAPYQKPVICVKSVFNYNKGLLPLNINQAQVKIYLDAIKAEKDKATTNASQNKELEIPNGEYLNTDFYTTIQNDFPETYGIGEVGLPTRASVERKSKAKQLKGYLLFFDQILGSYFKQLGQVSELLSVSGNLTRTLFTQVVKDIEGANDIVDGYDNYTDDSITELLFDQQDNNIERRNKILDHLLSRFAENFSEYVFVNKTIYGNTTDQVVLRDKENFLKDYKVVSKERGNAFDYYKQTIANLWNTNNVSGAEKRISRLIGIKDYSRRNLSNSFVQMYNFIDTDNQSVYRWRIVDKNNEIVLSSTAEYFDTSAANKELYFAVLQIIQTREYKIKEAFKNGTVKDLTIIDNILIQQSDAGKYSYDIINPVIDDKKNPDRIIARRFEYYNNLADLEKSILDLIQFMKEDFTEEGMFLVEHMMLRPDVNQTTVNPDTFMPICAEECGDCEPVDPYSYRVSVVLPGYTLRFANTDFRNYIEKIIKEELPAHVLAKVCWIGYREKDVKDPAENQLVQFEKNYKDYLFAKTDLNQEQPEPQLISFIKSLTSLDNVYPTGRLFDCSDENERLSDKIILGKTNLGSL
ncbi:Response regulator receiver (CheY-like) modulated diguanylate cyclase/phosphodiesterase [Flavobacterium anhuiense]|uniref:Response regulator receiver (CheY-like) modulated diguanylate cyclase/phosphodiesterase n=1 Tax=Flavobacterium anhuiense TaxID=459526 RepID=A0A444VXV2_9FLAO|nr:hypothetical protein [Flavobacterium anhuiense]RYJ38366.1 Response regulator receiver (CheY-like) modulated diguanylate cyclase/phosphodiesterase [Flavobacterium anhuiense]